MRAAGAGERTANGAQERGVGRDVVIAAPIHPSSRAIGTSHTAIPCAVASRGALSDFVDDLQAAGRLTFTRDEAMAALGVTMAALKQAALRLAKRRRLVSPRRGFYVIVPLEHRETGAPPVERWLGEMLHFSGVREIVREIVRETGGGQVVVTVDRFQRPVVVGPWRVRFRVGGARRAAAP